MKMKTATATRSRSITMPTAAATPSDNPMFEHSARPASTMRSTGETMHMKTASAIFGAIAFLHSKNALASSRLTSLLAIGSSKLLS